MSYRRTHGKGYNVNGLIRPNKTAAGCTFTRKRSLHSYREDSARLALFGTLDVLARKNMKGKIERSACLCCKAKTGPYRLRKK